MNTRESGQALPLGIALLFAGVLTGVVLFNTGEVVDEKTRLANAADAAVYSGITWQARALNFNAYTNRAMVANQVAMAQAVSLQSWAEYAKTTTANISTVLGPIPIVGPIATVVHQVMTAIEPVVSGLGTGILTFVDPINSALSTAQEAMYLSAFIASPQIIDSVAEANDSRITADSAFSLAILGNNLHDWSQFSNRFEKTDELAMDERVAMINASADRFTNDRSWNFFDRHRPSTPLISHRLERSGSTRLLIDEETGDTEWKAIDTLSLNNRLYYWFDRYLELEVPIGYSLKYANNQESSIENCVSQDEDSCGDWFGRNQLGQLLARSNIGSLRGERHEHKTTAAYQGVRAYRSLAREIRNENAPSMLLRTELRLATDDINDANSLNIATRSMDSVDRSSESDLSSVSSAEVFFNRPEDDAREEYASGYNPYWTVRLAPTTNAARMSAMALRGSANTAFAVAANLSVFEGEGSFELPVDIGTGGALAQWSPSAIGSSASDISSAGDLMQESLSDVFDDVLPGILSGVLPSGIQTASDAADQILGGIDTDAIADTVEDVTVEIDEVTERYEEAREEILQEFLGSVERLDAERGVRLSEINETIAALEIEATNSGIDRDEDIHQEIQALVAERDGQGDQLSLEQQFREDLANEFVDSVNRVLPEWPITIREALYVVDEYFRSGANVSDQINLVDLSNNSDAD